MIMPWKTVQRILVNLPCRAAEHAFLSMLLLIVSAGGFSLLLFYTYGFSSQTKEVLKEASLYDFKEELFLDTLHVLEKRAQNLENAKGEISPDVFNPG